MQLVEFRVVAVPSKQFKFVIKRYHKHGINNGFLILTGHNMKDHNTSLLNTAVTNGEID